MESLGIPPVIDRNANAVVLRRTEGDRSKGVEAKKLKDRRRKAPLDVLASDGMAAAANVIDVSSRRHELKPEGRRHDVSDKDM